MDDAKTVHNRQRSINLVGDWFCPWFQMSGWEPTPFCRL